MRKLKLHKIFHTSNNAGVSSVLIGQAETQQVMVDGFIPGLKLIPCGQRPPNPSELLGSLQMRSLLKSLKNEYDYVIIDSPPLAAVTDSMMLARIVDGICLVIKGGETSREVISRAVDLLRNAQAHILGTVINNIDIAKKSYYYYQYYYYSYYGDSGDEDTKDKMFKKHRRRSASDRNKAFHKNSHHL